MNNKKENEYLFLNQKYAGFKTENKIKIDIKSVDNYLFRKKIITGGSSIVLEKNGAKKVKITNNKKQSVLNSVEKQINVISKNLEYYNPCTEILRLEKKQAYIDARKLARKKLK